MVKIKIEDLYESLETMNVPISYHHFEKPPRLPYIIYLCLGSNNFGADNRAYHKINNYQIELYSDDKDMELEQKLEGILDNRGIFYEKYEIYIETEKMYQVAYEIQI